MYEYADKIIAYLNKRFIRLFGKLKGITVIDELNVINTVNSVYNEAEELVEKYFLELAQKVYKSTVSNPLTEIGEMWITGFLKEYNPTTKYVYTHEVERKAAKCAESILASNTKVKEIENALRYWSNMVAQYADDITLEATLQAYKDDGVEKVMWMTELDNRRCKECAKREGQVYDINKIPPKPHIGCRCWVVPWFGED